MDENPYDQSQLDNERITRDKMRKTAGARAVPAQIVAKTIYLVIKAALSEWNWAGNSNQMLDYRSKTTTINPTQMYNLYQMLLLGVAFRMPMQLGLTK